MTNGLNYMVPSYSRRNSVVFKEGSFVPDLTRILRSVYDMRSSCNMNLWVRQMWPKLCLTSRRPRDFYLGNLNPNDLVLRYLATSIILFVVT